MEGACPTQQTESGDWPTHHSQMARVNREVILLLLSLRGGQTDSQGRPCEKDR